MEKSIKLSKESEAILDCMVKLQQLADEFIQKCNEIGRIQQNTATATDCSANVIQSPNAVTNVNGIQQNNVNGININIGSVINVNERILKMLEESQRQNSKLIDTIHYLTKKR